MTKLLLWLTGTLFFGLPCLSARPVLLISLDGVRPDLIVHSEAQGLKLPNLRRFVTEGTYAEGVVGVLPTVTYPSHTTMLTGVWPSEHGIISNLPFDPKGENQAGWCWYGSDIKVPTLWQAADRAGIVTANVFWPVTVGADGIRYNIPEFWRAGTAEDIKLIRVVSHPDGFVTGLEATLGTLIGGSIDTFEADENHCRFAREILRSKRPGFMAVHLTSVDAASHEFGPFSPEAFRAIEALDHMVGQLREAALANDPRTVVLVVSDHGFAPTEQEFNWRIPFIAAGLLKYNAARKVEDWQASLWSGAGSAGVMLKDPQDSGLLGKVGGLLASLQADPANGIARVLPRADAGQLGGFPAASFILELRPGFRFGGATSGPVVTSSPHTGTHGHFPDRPEMRSSFFALGVDIAAGRNLGVVDMRQIAPTIASLLGVTLPTAKQPKLAVENESAAGIVR